MSRRKQAKPRSVKAVEEGESSECGGTWDGSTVQTDIAASERDADPKEGTGAEDGEPDEHEDRDDRDHDDDLDDESIFTCDNCQQDFDCLAELTEHRTNHCPA
ncbi:zinc finger protein 423-like, partial [Oreochromis aureus]